MVTARKTKAGAARGRKHAQNTQPLTCFLNGVSLSAFRPQRGPCVNRNPFLRRYVSQQLTGSLAALFLQPRTFSLASTVGMHGSERPLMLRLIILFLSLHILLQKYRARTPPAAAHSPAVRHLRVRRPFRLGAPRISLLVADQGFSLPASAAALRKAAIVAVSVAAVTVSLRVARDCREPTGLIAR